ncbi:hypothetical protein [Reyranella massiliensis]|uniref:hypothetical protein n=1 Tax=Reyranella massiliensis TaxID=445220 RepID=UPI0002F9697D|nr:hypothetical protein [Reyranella massiliensis]
MENGQNSTESKATATVGKFRGNRLTWIDYLVIAATVLTFAVVADAALGRAKASAPPKPAAAVTAMVSQLPDDPGLIKARLRLAAGL